MRKPALNATKHGLLSELPVLDGFETREGWQAHRQAFWDDLQPRGVVEEALVERIALTLWRMARLARAEVAAAQRRREAQVEQAARVWHPERRAHLPLAEARAELQHRDDLCDWLAAYASHAPSDPVPEPLSAALGLHLLSFLEECEASRENTEGGLPSSLPATRPSNSPRPVATAGGLCDRFDYAALLTGRSLDTVLQYVIAAAREAAYTLSRSIRDAERQVEQVRATTQLPEEHDLQLFTRYDAHLGRELSRLFRTLKELRTLPSPSSSPTPSSSSTPKQKLPNEAVPTGAPTRASDPATRSAVPTRPQPRGSAAKAASTGIQKRGTSSKPT